MNKSCSPKKRKSKKSVRSCQHSQHMMPWTLVRRTRQLVSQTEKANNLPLQKFHTQKLVLAKFKRNQPGHCFPARRWEKKHNATLRLNKLGPLIFFFFSNCCISHLCMVNRTNPYIQAHHCTRRKAITPRKSLSTIIKKLVYQQMDPTLISSN